MPGSWHQPTLLISLRKCVYKMLFPARKLTAWTGILGSNSCKESNFQHKYCLLKITAYVTLLTTSLGSKHCGVMPTAVYHENTNQLFIPGCSQRFSLCDLLSPSLHTVNPMPHTPAQDDSTDHTPNTHGKLMSPDVVWPGGCADFFWIALPWQSRRPH